MEATRIIAVRHGETTWNVDARIQGQLDIALNDRGHWQAQRVGRALAEEPIAAVYSSDLRRAWHTAEAIGRAAGVAVMPDPGLRERHFGLFEGKTFPEIEAAWPEHAKLWRRRVPDWSPPEGGESLLVLRERVQSTVGRIAARHAGEQIVLVAHGGVLDALYRVATGQAVDSPRTWELLNGAINRLLWSAGGLSVVGWSDTLHLEHDAIDENKL
ncbi:histidine phosphatase family protein [Ramlibacter rhizophilus]|uniref:Histidine phosphatase family protein n=1 Tax=Ramlibacter rhizophilus TaxID=1781167 RepID=A0A4Z0BLE9_9BURK|nr:histidine phosphatase family protein [Ramlibacter rhizophilus]TFY99571.1 histidine phosphatase family protein [Ramlibacter rhizophilus]